MSNNRNADILPASKAVGAPRDAGILPALPANAATGNADILSATKAGGTPAVQIRKAGILSDSKAGWTGPDAVGLSATTAGGTPAVRKNPLQKSGWHSRGYLPHWDPGNRPIHLVLRLYDSLPKHLLARWEEELRGAPDRDDQRSQRIEAALDQGMGECWLKQPKVARVVADALNHFNGDRYTLHAWVIMPNHVHALTTPAEAVTLSSIMHSWKSFTAKQANVLLKRTGQFWMEETYDRVMRNRKEVIATKAYIEQNPVAAGLCGHPAHWPWSSACTMAGETSSNAGILPATKAGGTPAVQLSNAGILPASKAVGAPRDAGILPALPANAATGNADILSATKAGGTPAVQLRNADILPAPNTTDTPAVGNSAAASEHLCVNQDASRSATGRASP